MHGELGAKHGLFSYCSELGLGRQANRQRRIDCTIGTKAPAGSGAGVSAAAIVLEIAEPNDYRLRPL